MCWCWVSSKHFMEMEASFTRSESWHQHWTFLLSRLVLIHGSCFTLMDLHFTYIFALLLQYTEVLASNA